MNLTKHASVRMKERSIPPMIVEWLWDHGSWFEQDDGAEVVMFDKSARRQLERSYGRLVTRRLGDFLNAYLIVQRDGAVVTIGHRHRRLRRK